MVVMVAARVVMAASVVVVVAVRVVVVVTVKVVVVVITKVMRRSTMLNIIDLPSGVPRNHLIG